MTTTPNSPPPRTGVRSLATSLAKAILLSLLLAATAAAQNKEKEKGFGCFSGENLARGIATKKVLPAYPAEAVGKGVAAIVEVRIGVDDDGVVRVVKVPPGTDPLLRRSAVLAAKLWRLPPKPDERRHGTYCTYRLTFHFRAEGGRRWAELYEPPPGSPAESRMRAGIYRVIELEWEQWEDASDDYDN